MIRPVDHQRTAIERILSTWRSNPQLRLGQLLSRCTRGVDLEYVHDEELLALLEASLNKTQKRQLDRDFPLPRGDDYDPPFG